MFGLHADVTRCARRGHGRQSTGQASEVQASLPAWSVRSTYVPVGCCLGALGSDAVQLIQDAALVDRMRRTAACPQRLQILLERAQLADALGDMPDVLVQELVDFTAVLVSRNE